MTAPPPPDEHRDAFDALLALAVAELLGLFDGLRGEQPAAIKTALAADLPGLLARYGEAAAALAADWYDDLRDAAGLRSRFRAIPADLPDAGRVDALLGWGLKPLFVASTPVVEDGVERFPSIGDPDFVPDLDAAAARLEGGFQKTIADMDRQTVVTSLAADPDGRGWERQTTGRSCDFCVMLAGRGAVYSADTADFASHDRCDCVAVPVFGGDPRPVQPYTPSQRRSRSTVTAAVARQYAQAAQS